VTNTPKLPELSLLEEMHSFPTVFIFKAIGDHHEGFVNEVLTVVKQSFDEDRSIEHQIKMSAQGKHSAITLHVFCKTSLEVHSVYYSLLRVGGLRALF
jgi:putative lipoic acid-binding regulatory protein